MASQAPTGPFRPGAGLIILTGNSEATTFTLGGVEADHVASIEYRTQAELGASAQWIDQKQDDWQRLGLAFRYGFSKEVFFTEDAEVLPNVSGPSRVLARSISKLSSRLGKSMSLGITYTVAYDSAPAEGKVNTDTGLSAMLEVGF